MMIKYFSFLLLFIAGNFVVQGQAINYDEKEVPKYTLPEILRFNNGSPVNTIKEWETRRRPEILSMFEEYVYGKAIQHKSKVKYEVLSIDKQALNGAATRKEITIFLSEDRTKKLNLLLYLPNKSSRPVPVFLGLNFAGNQSINLDPGISITKNWTRYAKRTGYDDKGFANELSRGWNSGRWPVEDIIARGYGLATAYYGDLQLDRKDIDSLPESFHKWFYEKDREQLKNNSGAAISIWAWGLSRGLDYLIKDKDVDGSKVAVIGHSRLGKSALWAGALDERFAMVISNNSGEAGASITRRKFGETIEVINRAFPHWVSYNFKKYNYKEDQLPVDFHELMSLIAPRPLYVASAAEDLWADPKGEYLSLYYAGPIYKMYGKQVFTSPEPPLVDQPRQIGQFGYHNRSGVHNITSYDWGRYLDFADKFFMYKGKK
jgi:hypothetical protein